MQYRIIRRDGEQRWVTENANVLTVETDRYVVGTLSDITQQRQAQEHGRDLSLLFETLIRSPSFSVAVFDGNQREVMVNASLCRRIGFERDSLVGSPASLFCQLPEAAMASGRPDAPADGPLFVSEAFALRHRDGRTLQTTAELWSLPSTMGTGSLLMVLPTPQS